jgi:hypothetical protein
MPLGSVAAHAFREACDSGAAALDDASLFEIARRRRS